MAGLIRYTGNRLDLLADRIAECIRSPLSAPLAPEIVIVQSKAMERWLSMELARRHGICANIRFPFPNAFLDELFRIMAPEYREAPPYDPEISAWRILAALPACLEQPVFGPLRAYLQDDGGLKGYQLACRLADLFDQYLIFRPDMMLRWETGASGYGEEAWQSELWRKIRQDDASCPPAHLRRLLLDRIRRPLTTAPSLPERVSIFGVSWLPPFHLEIFQALSGHLNIHFFALNPCREFWTDIHSDRETGKTVDKIREFTGRPALTATDLHLERGNSLLASMGKQGREFFRWFMDLPGEEHDVFADPGEASLLQAISSDILNLRERGADGRPKMRIDPQDRSILIHSCSSPMREVEALHDQLLALLDGDSELQPRDILIMAPDMETYAPLIEAVFDAASSSVPGAAGAPRIPFSIADRRLCAGSAVMEAFEQLLTLCDSRFEASAVLALLETPPVRKKYGLSEDDLERIRRWIMDVRIRWGVDAEGRHRAGLPFFPDNTWASGMERLLLGYALPGTDERLFNGILPYDAIEGLEAQTLGVLAEYLDNLFSSARDLKRARTPAQWADALSGLLTRFFEDDEETHRDMETIREVFERLACLGASSGYGAAAPPEVVSAFLKGKFEKQEHGRGYLHGGVTCCAMLPMRSIPFKVIVLLGMNSDAYPRPSAMQTFDLMTKTPLPGDRSRRHDDRYLFLEALLAAKQHFIISYVGQNTADHSISPPSVLVSELLDVIEQGFSREEGDIRTSLIMKHRLQAFHADYFTAGSGLFSYSEANSRASRQLQAPHRNATPFFCAPLPDPGDAEKSIALNDLVLFFKNPCRFLIERRLGASLGKETDRMIDQESFVIKGLEKYDLERRLVEKGLAGQDMEALFPLFRAAGSLPHGTVGVALYKNLIGQAENFAARVRPCLGGELPAPVDFSLQRNDYRLQGRIEDIFGGALFHFRYADLKAGDHLRLWIHHLILNLESPEPDRRASTMLGRDATWIYAPVEDAGLILDQLLEIYYKGLSFPQVFFPNASWKFAEQLLLKGKSVQQALQAARSVWTGSDYFRGESQDRYYRFCYDDRDTLNDDFQRLAVLVYGPLLKHGTPA
jgi:exodeoxyribonuclease V gamma subunit